MKKESNVVLYTRTEASDFRPFLNFGPDSLATNPKVFDEISRIVDDVYSAPDNVRVVLFVGRGCLCGIAGQPPVRDFIKERRNIAFIGLYFDDQAEAVMPSRDFLWSLYDKAVSGIWDVPSDVIKGPEKMIVPVPVSEPRFDAWIGEQIRRYQRGDSKDVVAVTCPEDGIEPGLAVGDDRFVFMTWRKDKARDGVHYPVDDPKNENNNSSPDDGSGSVQYDTILTGVSDRAPQPDIVGPYARMAFGDLEAVDPGLSLDPHIRVYRSNDRAILAISSDEDVPNSKRSRGFKSAIMKSLGLGDTTLEVLIKAASRIGEQVESGRSIDLSDHHRTYVLYPVRSLESAVENARDVLRTFDFLEYGVNAVIMCEVPCHDDWKHGRFKIFYQGDPRDIRSDVLCDWAEYVALSRPVSHVGSNSR